MECGNNYASSACCNVYVFKSPRDPDGLIRSVVWGFNLPYEIWAGTGKYKLIDLLRKLPNLPSEASGEGEKKCFPEMIQNQQLCNSTVTLDLMHRNIFNNVLNTKLKKNRCFSLHKLYSARWEQLFQKQFWKPLTLNEPVTFASPFLCSLGG